MKLLRFIPLLLLLTGCAKSASLSDEPDTPGESVAVTFSITPRTQPAATPGVAGDDPEYMKEWTVVFVNQGTVMAVATRPDGTQDAVSAEQVSVELPRGRYTAYGFANLTLQELEALTGTITVGQAAPDFAAANYDLAAKWNASKFIPMSGKLDFTVTTHLEQQYAIEVVRLVAKMRLRLSNASKRDIAIKSFKLGPVGTGAVPLMHGDMSAPVITQADTVPVTVSATAALTAQTGTASLDVYLHESNAAIHPTGHFHLALTLRRGDRTEDDTINMMLTDLTSFYRNDFIIVPIALTDVDLRVAAHAYPPIGGLPPSVERRNEEEFYVKFQSSGLFEISSEAYDAYTGLPLDGAIQSYSIDAIDAPTDFFQTTPAIDATTGEIVGEMGNVSGTATIRLTYQVKLPVDTHVIRTFKRTLYLIRS